MPKYTNATTISVQDLAAIGQLAATRRMSSLVIGLAAEDVSN